jgi:hypothetical protein
LGFVVVEWGSVDEPTFYCSERLIRYILFVEQSNLLSCVVVSNINRNVKLLRVQDNQIVDAILTIVTDKHLADTQNLWLPQLTGTGYSDVDWNWEKKSRLAKILPGDELYAIECEGITQGLMTIDILKKRCQIESQHRRRLVYISALATAPWNRPAINNPPTYKGVGKNLVDFAIARSYELRYQGRVGLHTLPDAIEFYQKIRVGLLDCGLDPDEPDNLVYFEILRRNL